MFVFLFVSALFFLLWGCRANQRKVGGKSALFFPLSQKSEVFRCVRFAKVEGSQLRGGLEYVSILNGMFHERGGIC